MAPIRRPNGRQSWNVTLTPSSAAKLRKSVAARSGRSDFGLHENVLRKWVREQAADPGSAFPGDGVMRPKQQEIERLRQEPVRTKAERDVPKRTRQPTSPETRYEVRVHREAPRDLADIADVRGTRCFLASGFHARLLRAPSARADEEFGEGPPQLHLQLSHVRCAPRLARPSGRSLSCGVHRAEWLMRLQHAWQRVAVASKICPDADGRQCQ